MPNKGMKISQVPPSPDAQSDPSARYEAAVRFLAGRIDYERTHAMPSSEEGMKLDRMRELLRRLGNPQDRIAIVHVAGTKGKGSTAAMIAGVLSRGWLRDRTVHLAPPGANRGANRRRCPPLLARERSPNWSKRSGRRSRRWTERRGIVVSGQWPVASGRKGRGERGGRGRSTEYAGARDARRDGFILHPYPHLPSRPPSPANPSLGPTYFEIVTAMAFCHFARRAKVAVLEVGLGGRLDSTNVCTPLVSIITSISFDHTSSWATRWRPSPRKRPASSSRACRSSAA